MKKIFGNLGVEVAELDAIWVGTLSSYGVSRGTIAHTSAMVEIPINIQEAINETNIILQGIENFEMELIRKNHSDFHHRKPRL